MLDRRAIADLSFHDPTPALGLAPAAVAAAEAAEAAERSTDGLHDHDDALGEIVADSCGDLDTDVAEGFRCARWISRYRRSCRVMK